MARPDLTGILLVGGASRRFGSAKALAPWDGKTLAVHGWETLGEACAERLAVGKLADGLELPFPIVDDGTTTRAALAGIVAGLRAADTERCVVLPVDMPLVRPRLLLELAHACADAAVTQTGPLPAAFSRPRALPVLERRLREQSFALRDAVGELDTREIHAEPGVLANVNTPGDLQTLACLTASAS